MGCCKTWFSRVASFRNVRFVHSGLLQNVVFACAECEVVACWVVSKSGFRVLRRFKT